MAFLEGFIGGIGQQANQLANKMSELRTSGYNHMADLYTRLADAYKDNPTLMSEYVNRASAYTKAASNPFDRSAAGALKGYDNPGEPLQNFLTQQINDKHMGLTGQPAPKEFTPWPTKQTSIPGISQPAPMASAQPPPTQQQNQGFNPMDSINQMFGGQRPEPYTYSPSGHTVTNPDYELYTSTVKGVLPEFFKPMVTKPGETLTTPAMASQGKSLYSNPRDIGLLSAQDQYIEIAAIRLARQAGLPLNPGRSAISQLPPNLQTQAANESKQLQETPSLLAMRESVEAMRRMQAEMNANKIEEYNANKANAESIAHDALFNPNLLNDPKLNPTVRTFAIQHMRNTGQPIPNRVSDPMVQQEEFVRNALVHARQIKEIVNKHPDMIGPVIGRLTGFDQETGVPIFTDFAFPPGDPRRTIEQELRTRLSYLFTNEVRGAMPGRPAIQFINVLKKVSASPNMAPQLFNGALDGMVAASRVAQRNINKARYGSPHIPVPPYMIDQFIQASGGDADVAREMAADAGYLVPGFNQ